MPVEHAAEWWRYTAPTLAIDEPVGGDSSDVELVEVLTEGAAPPPWRKQRRTVPGSRP